MNLAFVFPYSQFIKLYSNTLFDSNNLIKKASLWERATAVMVLMREKGTITILK